MADRSNIERLRGFDNGQMDICDSRVAFATENDFKSILVKWLKHIENECFSIAHISVKWSEHTEHFSCY